MMRRSAFAAAMTAAAFALAGTQAQAQSKSAQDACLGDYQKLCSTTLPGGGRVAKCLVAHKDELTDGCKTALRDEAARRQAGNSAKQ
jgi:hypothetical protein